jgi:hypothetical protein
VLAGSGLLEWRPGVAQPTPDAPACKTRLKGDGNELASGESDIPRDAADLTSFIMPAQPRVALNV